MRLQLFVYTRSAQIDECTQQIAQPDAKTKERFWFPSRYALRRGLAQALGIMNIRMAALILVVLTLNACAAPVRGIPVAPGQEFGTDYIQIRAPQSPGWEKMSESHSGITFAKGNRSINQSFIAFVRVFGLPPTRTQEDFLAFVKTAAQQDQEPSRFEVQSESFQYSDHRGYPCVAYKTVTKDKKPQATTSPLLLEMDALYCRHPHQPESGFAAMFSHRAEFLYPNLGAEAKSFIEGVQVPKQ